MSAVKVTTSLDEHIGIQFETAGLMFALPKDTAAAYSSAQCRLGHQSPAHYAVCIVLYAWRWIKLECSTAEAVSKARRKNLAFVMVGKVENQEQHSP